MLASTPIGGQSVACMQHCAPIVGASVREMSLSATLEHVPAGDLSPLRSSCPPLVLSDHEGVAVIQALLFEARQPQLNYHSGVVSSQMAW
jgi:hypothetical protein